MFGRWDKSEDQGQRQRCLFPNPNHCGRSPIFLDSYEMSALELSPDLFARKVGPAYLIRERRMNDEFSFVENCHRLMMFHFLISSIFIY